VFSKVAAGPSQEMGKENEEQVKAEAAKLFDVAGFEEEIRKARDDTRPSHEEEMQHLAKLELWTTILGAVGCVCMVRGVLSPISMIALGYYRYAKFAILAHHSLHGGWGIHRRGWFAQGIYRRMVDWLDWIFPDAWVIEHNKVHHYRLNEDADPDYVQRNTELVRKFPTWPVRYAMVGVNAAIWKWAYYASNTLKILHAHKPGAPAPEVLDQPLTLNDLMLQMLTCRSWSTLQWYLRFTADFIFRVMGPPLVWNFVFIPMCAYVIGQLTTGSGWHFFTMAVVNFLGAELVNNVHAFCTIVTNHAGVDLWHFDEPCRADCGEFYLRATLGSAAYHAGTDLIDYFHGFLNYQCEHHAFPALSPLHYQRLHPRFKAVCAKYGVPYVQEPFWVRTKKTADIITGAAVHKEMQGQASHHPEMWIIDPKIAGN